MDRKISLLYIIPSLDGGGAQRFSIHFLRHLDREKFQITLLILLDVKGELEQYLPTDIEIVRLKHKRTVSSTWSVIKETRKRKPDILFSTLGHLNLIVALVKSFLPKKTRVVVRETSVISLRNKDERYPKLFDFMFRTIYHKLDLVICQSIGMRDDLINNYNVPKKILTVIYNPVDFSLMKNKKREKPADHSKRIDLLAVGRLSTSKGYDRLIDVMSRLKDKRFHLKILGQGPIQQELQKQIDNLGLTQQIELAGFTNDPFQYMADSDCMLMGSRYEGLPNVVLESNACGTPVISFNAPGGVGELIENGVNGWLIPNDDIEGFTKEVAACNYLKVDRDKVKEVVISKYDVGTIIRQYEQVLTNV